MVKVRQMVKLPDNEVVIQLTLDYDPVKNEVYVKLWEVSELLANSCERDFDIKLLPIDDIIHLVNIMERMAVFEGEAYYLDLRTKYYQGVTNV